MQNISNILCVLDEQTLNPAIVARAIAFAERYDASLTVACVVEKIHASIAVNKTKSDTVSLEQHILEEMVKRLDEVVASCATRPKIRTKAFAGTQYLQIIREVLSGNYDLLLKEAEDPAWLDRLFGSDDLHLLRKCPCPVWLVKPKQNRNYRSIVVAIDIDEECPDDELEVRHQLNKDLVELASTMAMFEEAELHMVHIWDAVGENIMRQPFVSVSDEQIDEYIEKVRRQREYALDSLIANVAELEEEKNKRVKLHKHLVKGFAQQELPKWVKELNADLVVMGTIARTGIPGMIIGNTAESILYQIDCSVLAIKPPGFVSPVTPT